MHEAETLRLPDDRSGDEVGIDALQERRVQVLCIVPAIALQHVQQ